MEFGTPHCARSGTRPQHHLAEASGGTAPFWDAQLLDDGLQLRVGGGGDAGAHVHQAAGVVKVACGTWADSSTVTVSPPADRHPGGVREAAQRELSSVLQRGGCWYGKPVMASSDMAGSTSEGSKALQLLVVQRVQVQQLLER